MKIAKIVKSNSHVDYIGRVVDTLDAIEPPRFSDYGFGQFVALAADGDDDERIIGVIYNTMLANPEYGSLGPRLSPPSDLSVLTPDYLNEQGVLIGILLLGWQDRKLLAYQNVPRRVAPVGCEVHTLSNVEMMNFHRATDETLHLHYYSQVMAHAGAFAVPLLETIISGLEPHCAPEERQRLCVLKKSLAWQRTMNVMRL
jgi:hypothetical protein